MQQKVYPSNRTFYMLMMVVCATTIAVVAFILSAMTFSVSTLLAADGTETPDSTAVSLRGSAWFDQNRNGSYDSDEQPLVEELIYVVPDREDVFAQTLVLYTDQAGNFAATNLTPGRYRVWAQGQDESQGIVVNVGDDRSTPTFQLAVVSYQLYMPLISNHD